MLNALIRLADAAYRAGAPLLSDAAFDRLVRLAPDALPPLTTLLSLDCHPEPLEWLERHAGPYVVQLKADGVSVNLIYIDGRLRTAHLRSGRDCTAAALRAGAPFMLPGSPSGRVEIRCEAMALACTNAGITPSRNAVAAALRRTGQQDRIKLSLLAFDLVGIDAIATHYDALVWLKCAGFATLDTLLCDNATEVMTMFDSFCACRASLPFPCDGITVKLNCKQRQRDLGNDSRAPRWAISMKP